MQSDANNELAAMTTGQRALSSSHLTRVTDESDAQ